MDLRKVRVVMPRVNANDDAGILVRWMKQAGEAIREGDVIALIETTKAAVDIEAQAHGYIHPLVEPGAMVAVDDPIAWIIDPYEPAALAAEEVDVNVASTLDEERTISRKAAELMKTAGLSAADFPGDLPIKEADVRALLKTQSGSCGAGRDLVRKLQVTERSVLLFGAGDQAVVVADCLNVGNAFTPLCFVDEAPRAAELEGLPVFDASVVEELLAIGVRLAHVCIGAPKPKLRIAQQLKEAGFTIIQAIHPAAILSPSAAIGEGVYIGPGVLLGPRAVVGDYSQVNNGATVPHHVEIGIGVRVSDGVHLAGGVRVGDRAYLGLGVTVNTDCHVGSDVTIVSGVSVFDSIPDGAISARQ